MGRIARSWELVEKSVGILTRHKSLMFLPVASAIASAAVSVAMLSICALAFRPEIQAFLAVRHQRPTMSQPMWIFFFVFYLVNYCIVVYFNVALVTIVSRILEGGAASISDGLQAAWERKGRIFQWALLAATVGVFLQALEERLGFLGRIAVRLFGAAWALASYFGSGPGRQRRGSCGGLNSIRAAYQRDLGRGSGGKLQLRPDFHNIGDPGDRPAFRAGQEFRQCRGSVRNYSDGDLLGVSGDHQRDRSGDFQRRFVPLRKNRGSFVWL